MNSERFEPVLRLLDDAPFHRSRRSRLAWGAVTLVLLATAVYVRGILVDGFFWLDQATLNSVSSLFSLGHVWVQFSGTYQPLSQTLLWLERRGFGELPVPYHCVGLAAHAASCVLLWLILRRLGVRGAWLAAALFAVHPIQVQSVAWITHQPILICSAFYLLSIWLYLRWLQVQPPIPAKLAAMEPADPPSRIGYVAALAACVAAVLSDPLATSLPFVLLLLVWWKRSPLRRSDLLNLAPFFGIAVIGIAAGLILYQSTSDPFGAAPSLSALQRVAIAAGAIGFYAFNLVRLFPTEFIYPRWNPAWGVWTAVPMLLIAAIGIIAWAGRRRWGAGPVLCLLLFIVLLLPGIVTLLSRSAPTIYIAGHQQYLASAVPLAMFAAALIGIATWLSSMMSPRVARSIVGILAIGLLGAFAAIASLGYQDPDTGFKVILAHHPGNEMARAQYALQLLDEEPSMALKVLDDVDPTEAADLTLLDARARVCTALGRRDEAISNYLLAQRLAPDCPSIPLGLGSAYDAAGEAAIAEGHRDDAFEDYNNALAEFDTARRLNPKDAAVLDGIGKVLLHEDRFDESINYFDAALAQNPAYAAAHVHKAQALFNAGMQGDNDKVSLAMSELREALRIDPSCAEALCASGDMQFRMRNYAAAEFGYRAAVYFSPASATTWTNLGYVQAAQSRYQEALRSFERALSLRSDAPDALRGKRSAQAQLAMGNQKP